MGIACDPFRENVPIIPESKKRRLPAPHIKGSARKEEYLRVGLLVRDDLARNGSTRGGWNPSEPIGNIAKRTGASTPVLVEELHCLGGENELAHRRGPLSRTGGRAQRPLPGAHAEGVRSQVTGPMHAALISAAGLAVVAYGSTLAMLLRLQGRFIYPLERIRGIPPNPAADRLEPVTVRTRDGLELSIRHKAPAEPDGITVVLFHGNGEDLSQRAHIAHDLIAAGCGVLLAEYRGYGGNPGKPHEAGLYADGRAALEFAYLQTSRVVLHGYSLGSGVAVQLATEFPVDALVLEAPFTCIADVARTRFPYVPVRWLLRDRYDNLSKIGAVRSPVLIYGGLADGVIPPHQFTALHTAVRGPRRLALIDDANHVDVWTKGGADHVLAFLQAVSDDTRHANA